jgi:hypothetical protein
VIFETSGRIGKAQVVITSAVSGESEQLSNVHRVSIVGQTLVVSKVRYDGTYWTSTYPEASVMLDISGTTGE